jgi:hypothetical protein
MTHEYYPMKPLDSLSTPKVAKSVSNTVESIVSDDCKLTDEPKPVDNNFWAALVMIALCLLYAIQ